MKMLYVVNTRHDTEAYRVYSKVHMNGRATTGTKVASVVLGAFIVAGGIMAVINQGPKVLYVLSILAGLLIGFSQPIGLWRMQRQLLKNAQNIQMKIDYRFSDNGFDVTFPGQSESLSYGDLKKIVETGGYYFLYTDVRMAHILPKKHFTQGDAASFGAFVSEKSGVALTKMDV